MNKYYEFNFTEEQVKNEFLKFFVSNTKKFSNKFNLTESLNYFATLISKEIFNFKINSAAILLNEFINWRIHNKPDELGILLKDVVNRINLYAIANNDFVDITKDENFKELYEAFQNKSIDTIEQYEQGLLDNKEIPCKITEFSGTKLFQPITTIAFNKVDDENFKYFFTLKLRQMSVFKMNEFLDFHLNDIFQGNTSEFDTFIDHVLIEYEQFISPIKQLNIRTEMKSILKNNGHKEYEKYSVFKNLACLQIIYDELNEGFIEQIDLTVFLQHFLNNNPNPPINIVNNKTNVIKLMEKLCVYFDSRATTHYNNKLNCDVWICQHFVYKGKPLDPKNLQSLRGKIISNFHPSLNSMLNKVKKMMGT